MYKTSMRTHHCNELRSTDINNTITLCGWVYHRRDHGGIIFIDLRDRYGITQITFDTEKGTPQDILSLADHLRSEWCIQITGTVISRPDGQTNTKLDTGEIEIIADTLRIFGKSETPPFEIDSDTDINEDVRLEYRYLDLRRDTMQKNIRLRHDYIKLARDFFYNRGFIEIQTPLLTASTPEGSRDYLVPSRMFPGSFYALPQSPQQYKQLLMIGGFDKYFQLAPAMRDEDSRADRIYGVHYQLDIEMSFVDQDDVINLLEEFFVILSKTLGERQGMILKNEKFPKLSYQEALEKYGSDKPDIRYDLKIVDISDIGHASDFQVFKTTPFIRGIKVEGGANKMSRKDIDDLITFSKTLGSGGLAWMKVNEESKLDSNIVKYFSDELQTQILDRFQATKGDILFYIADSFDRSCVYLDKIRRKLAEDLKLYDPNEISFVWITDMPFFEWNDEESKIDISHNPFSKPKCSKEEFLNAKTKNELLAIKACQYDLACNGYEMLSGGERNYDPDILDKVFSFIGYTENEINESFGHMLKAFKYGAPPTAGAGMGIERMLIILTKEANIKNIVAFPHNQKGYDPMMKSPRPATEKQLKELGIMVKKNNSI